jgi:hypothetical protein
MKNRGKENSPFENLDSFLDTLFNVAGILIIFLIIVQISASGAMSAINHELDDQQSVQTSVTLAREKLVQETANARELQGELHGLTNQNAPLQTQAISLKKEHEDLLVELNASSTALNATLNQLGLSGSKTNATVISDLIEQANEYSKIKGDLAKELKKLNASRKSMKETRLKVSAKNEIRVPIPRDPPIGSRVIWFYCRYGKIVPTKSSFSLARNFFKEVQAIISIKPKGDFDVTTFNPRIFATRTQAKLIREHFILNPISNDYLRLSFDKEGYVAFRVNPQGKGDDEKSILKQDSHYKECLKKFGPDSHHIKFLVWEDSFPVYLEARAIADRLGFKCGWEPTMAWKDNVITLNERLYPTFAWKKNID